MCLISKIFSKKNNILPLDDKLISKIKEVAIMEQTEIFDFNSYVYDEDDPISELNLRPMYMIDDFDELVNTGMHSEVTNSKPMERAVRVAS